LLRQTLGTSSRSDDIGAANKIILGIFSRLNPELTFSAFPRKLGIIAAVGADPVNRIRTPVHMVPKVC
jgi:hypothetical protein